MAAVLAVLCLSSVANSQTIWQLPGGGSWATLGNWSAGIPNAGTVAAFEHPAFGGGTVTLDGNAVAAGLSFSSSASGYATLTINPGSLPSSTLTLGASGLTATDSHIAINAPVVLSADQSWSANFNSSIHVQGIRLATGLGNTTLTNSGLSNGFVRFGSAGIDLSNTTSNLTLNGTGDFGLTASQTWRLGHLAATPQRLTIDAGTEFDAAFGITLTLAPENPGSVMSSIVFNTRFVSSTSAIRIAPTRFGLPSTTMGAGLVEIGGTSVNSNVGPITVDGGTLYLRKTQSVGTHATTNILTVNGGQLLIGTGITNALPTTMQLVMTNDGTYNNGLPTATGSLTNVPLGHTQTYASIAFGSGISGGFNTGASELTVTGTFTASGMGSVTVNPGGYLMANRLDMPAVSSRGEIFVRASNILGVLEIGTGGLNMVGRNITLSAPVANNIGGWLILMGDVTASGTSSFTGVNTGAHQVRLNGMRTFDIASGGTFRINGAPLVNNYTTVGGFIKTGAGTLRLESVGGFTGGVRIDAGRLVMASGAAIANSVPITINGGQLSTAGGPGSGASFVGIGEQAGFLNVTAANSQIEFGTGAHILRFSALSGGGNVAFPTGANLTIFNWQGTAGGPGTEGRLVFADNVNFSPDILSRISFDGYSSGATVIAFTGGGFEMVPVPEPTTVIGMAALGLVALRLRKRLTCRIIARETATPVS